MGFKKQVKIAKHFFEDFKAQEQSSGIHLILRVPTMILVPEQVRKNFFEAKKKHYEIYNFLYGKQVQNKSSFSQLVYSNYEYFDFFANKK